MLNSHFLNIFISIHIILNTYIYYLASTPKCRWKDQACDYPGCLYTWRCIWFPTFLFDAFGVCFFDPFIRKRQMHFIPSRNLLARIIRGEVGRGPVAQTHIKMEGGQLGYPHMQNRIRDKRTPLGRQRENAGFR